MQRYGLSVIVWEVFVKKTGMKTRLGGNICNFAPDFMNREFINLDLLCYN